MGRPRVVAQARCPEHRSATVSAMGLRQRPNGPRGRESIEHLYSLFLGPAGALTHGPSSIFPAARHRRAARSGPARRSSSGSAQVPSLRGKEARSGTFDPPVPAMQAFGHGGGVDAGPTGLGGGLRTSLGAGRRRRARPGPAARTSRPASGTTPAAWSSGRSESRSSLGPPMPRSGAAGAARPRELAPSFQ